MDKEAVIARYHQLVKELGEEARDVVLSAGAALVIMGVREETEDLDVDVKPGVFSWAAKGKTILDDGLTPRFAFGEDVDLHIANEDTGVACVDGVWIYSPSAMLFQKRLLARFAGRKPEKREKDLAEIAILERIVKQQKFTTRVVA